MPRDAGRRDALRVLAAMTEAPLLNGCGCPTVRPTPDPSQPPSPGVPGPTAELDIHCHVFNVRDIPAYAYVVDVLFENAVVRIVAAPLAWMIVRIAVESAPDYQQEADALDAHLSAGRTLVAASDNRPTDDASVFVKGFRAFVDKDTSYSGAPSKSNMPANERFIRQLYDMYIPDQIRLGIERDGLPGALIDEENIRALFKALNDARQQTGTDIFSYIAQFLSYFAIRVSEFRYKLAAELASLFPSQNHPPRLLTPATLDIRNWLRSADVDASCMTSLSQQSDLMRRIALLPGPNRVHGLIAFDPWQYVDDVARGVHPNALEIVHTALTCDGFIGVKLYPPMGFRATDNCVRGDDEFPARLVAGHKNLGRKLDCALDALYTYCVRNDVPIIAHCAATQGTSDENALCADPAHWLKVLKQERYRTLRVNLGHYGALWEFDKTLTTKSSVDVSWTAYIVGMIVDNDFPNLYADIGDFVPVLGRTCDEREQSKRILERLGALFREPKNAKVKSRILYGSDWLMLGVEPGFEDYAAQVRALVPKALDVSEDQLVHKNAATFLGLAEGDKTLERLRNFYVANECDPRVLDPFRP